MKRAMVASVALLSAGCAFRPWTPSVSVAYGAQDVPPAEPMRVAPASDLLSRWQLPSSNPWAAYTKLTLLSSLDARRGVAELPQVGELDVVRRAEHAASVLAAAGLPRDTLFILDLRGAASVAFGATLSRAARDPVSPVATFNNWPGDDEMVPAEETLAALVTMSPKMPGATETRSVPVFMLDAWRLAYREDVADEEVLDNRYMLDASSFPSTLELQAQGINHVLYVVESLDDAEHEEDDVHAAARTWQQAGVTVHMVDLSWLQSLSAPLDWDMMLRDYRLVIEPRQTIVEDPGFYARSQGGFGGRHGLPSPFRYGGSYRGVGHGGGG
ncbi:MAG: hypothetical protein HY898_16540 [Deltaproteobacteria bacterium]|nr:hypothetical protein [Deltaproteobacteria bacterium]